MSAEVLRRAAALMRERAAAAAPIYVPMPAREDIGHTGTCDGCATSTALVASYPEPENEPWLCAECAASADFEGSWHPMFAFAVADWLEQHARGHGWHLIDVGRASSCVWLDDRCGAFIVARAYLGESV